ncbi:MAG TPA: phosphatase PAP2 family protein [Nocardioidaceae bacterium]|nr:phosphatase PAP2 family protein [Nocardioidaceae bacterium]
MSRRAYGLLVGVAIGMGIVALITAQALDEPLRDPDGFLGPAWVRLPAMVVGAFVLDVVPRSVWRSRRSPSRVGAEARAIVKEHWTPERIAVVAIGITAFYVTYVSYRNLKNGLLIFHQETKDKMLHDWDKALFLGNEPAVFLHTVLGESFSAHVLAFVYLLFLPLAPMSIVAWLVWSRNVTYGYWYVTANCLCWTLGTASYYAIPSLGPAFEYPWLYRDLDQTGVTDLINALWNGRYSQYWNPFADGVQSVAGFASLHCAIILCMAMVAHYTVRHASIRWFFWIFFVLTFISTIYFGWHYLADSIVGSLIAVVSVYLGGLATGQKFDRHGMESHPTTTTAQVPVDATDAH